MNCNNLVYQKVLLDENLHYLTTKYKLNWEFILPIEHSTSLGKSFADNFTRLRTRSREKTLRCKLEINLFLIFGDYYL